MADSEGYDYVLDGENKIWLETPNVKDGSQTVTATYPNGNKFVGTYVAKADAPEREVVKEGQGTYTWSYKADEAEDDEGRKKPVCEYSGSWKDGKKHGLGKITYPNGDSYHGLWEAGKRHGQGTYTYSNGDIYSGGWKEDKKQGEGAYEYATDGSQMIGTWNNGKFADGEWIYENGSYQGTYADGKFEGKGTFQFAHAKRIETGRWIETTEEVDGEEFKSGVWKSSLRPEAEAPKAPEVEEDDE